MSAFTPEQADRFAEWLPVVKDWASKKKQDVVSAEGVYIAALDKCVRVWPGAGPFEGYLRRAIKNAWINHMEKESRHDHTAFPEGDIGIDADSCQEGAVDMVPAQEPGQQRARPRLQRRRFRGGDSSVFMAVVEKEAVAALAKGDWKRVMHVLGNSREEIEQEEKRRKDRERKTPKQAFDELCPPIEAA